MFYEERSLFETAHARVTQHPVEGEPLRSGSSPESAAASDRAGRQTNATLPNTADRVQQIQASLASSIKAEFASVTGQLNASQGKSRGQSG
jgi:hypothetical protein